MRSGVVGMVFLLGCVTEHAAETKLDNTGSERPDDSNRGTNTKRAPLAGNKRANPAVSGSPTPGSPIPGSPTAACDPSWQTITKVPENLYLSVPGMASPSEADETVLVALGAGRVSLFDGKAWTVVNDHHLPRLRLGRSAWVAFHSSFISSASDVFAFGSRGTVLHWDGNVWTVEHQDRRLSPRDEGDIRLCGGELLLKLRSYTVRRASDGSWHKLDAQSRRASAPCFAPTRLPRPDVPCGRYWSYPEATTHRCRDGQYIWHPNASRWIRHAPFQRSFYNRLPVAAVGEQLFVASSPTTISVWRDGTWHPEQIDHAGPIRRLWVQGARLYAMVGHDASKRVMIGGDVISRTLCE